MAAAAAAAAAARPIKSKSLFPGRSVPLAGALFAGLLFSMRRKRSSRGRFGCEHEERYQRKEGVATYRDSAASEEKKRVAQSEREKSIGGQEFFFLSFVAVVAVGVVVDTAPLFCFLPLSLFKLFSFSLLLKKKEAAAATFPVR